MDLSKVENCTAIDTDLLRNELKQASVSLETEIPEVLYQAMKDFIGVNENWNQYKVMSSALASFLFQNGSGDRAVTERYLDDLFSRSDS